MAAPMATPTEGEPTTSVRARLESELRALHRRRSQYRVALETASDSRIITRMVTDLRRLDDEISGVEEALAALPEPEPVQAPLMPVMPSLPSLRPVDRTGALRFAAASGPDWDDEPATTLYDGASRVAPLPKPATPAEGASPTGPGSPQEGVTGAAEGHPVPLAGDSSENASAAATAEAASPAASVAALDAAADDTSASAEGVGATAAVSGSKAGIDGSPLGPTAGGGPASGPTAEDSVGAAAEGVHASAGVEGSPREAPPGVPVATPRVPSGPVSIDELQALEANTEWNSELSPASFADPELEAELRPVPRRWIALACGGGVLLVVAVWVLVAITS